MPPRLSAVAAINPALEWTKSMLFRPFRFKTWMKIGFIGWLAGGAYSSGNFNYSSPSLPGQEGGGQAASQVFHWLHEHLLLIMLIVGFAVALGVLFFYLSCRFRFILFDSILQKDAHIGRGWANYRRQAHRYLGFMVAYSFITLIVLSVVVGVPIWRAYKNGIFHKDNPFPEILSILLPMVLVVLLVVIAGAIVSSLANDFGVPLLALDDMPIGEALSALRRIISADPWAFAGYLGMKLVLSIAAGAMILVSFLIIFLVLLIPGVILVLVGVGLTKALGPVVGVLLAVIGVLAVMAVVIIMTLLSIAPVAVFFTSYSLHFLAGRYPKLADLLWPQPPGPIVPPSMSSPPPPLPGAAPAL